VYNAWSFDAESFGYLLYWDNQVLAFELADLILSARANQVCMGVLIHNRRGQKSAFYRQLSRAYIRGILLMRRLKGVGVVVEVMIWKLSYFSTAQ
jgi:hypothetical protein